MKPSVMRGLYGIAAALMAGAAVWAGELDAAKRPNILFIFSDDHAQHALSCYGSKVNSTPHLNRLANEGARFTNSFVTNSICSPSRATLLPSNQQTIAHDLTNRDLKREPPAGLEGKERSKWLGTKVDAVDVDGKTLTGKGAVRWRYQRFMYEPGLRVSLLARGPGIKAGITPDAFVANIDLAPTFLDLAGLPVPESMHGRSLAPLLRGEPPAGWRKSVYDRYYHDPGDHNTRAHYGVRTTTHKLIHYFKQDSYELFELMADPHEQHNLLFDEAKVSRLQREYGDHGRYADPASPRLATGDGLRVAEASRRGRLPGDRPVHAVPGLGRSVRPSRPRRS